MSHRSQSIAHEWVYSGKQGGRWGRWGVSKGRVGIGIEWVYGGVRLIVYGLKTFYFV